MSDINKAHIRVLRAIASELSHAISTGAAPERFSHSVDALRRIAKAIAAPAAVPTPDGAA